MLPSLQFVKAIILFCLLNEAWSDQTNCLKRFKRGTHSMEYAAIIDGGSSGSRIRVYEWERVSHDDTKALPNFKEIFSKKKSPGVSDYEDKQAELRDYFKDLISAALLQIPDAAHSRTDLYFMATAGMRLLLEDKANSMIEKIDKLLADKSFHPMRYLSPDNSRILSGEEEGVFAWISVNYLKNVFKEKNVRPKKTYGILELGGASTQIAFAPSGNILADKFPVLISGVNYYLYVHSYLYYGQNYVDQWLKTALYENQSKDAVNIFAIQNPCMVKGDVQQKELDKNKLNFIGAGNYTWCQKVLNDFVYRIHDSWKCNPKPCAIGTVYQPTIKPSMEFIAVGAFVHAFNKLKVLSEDGKFSYPNTQRQVEYFCGLQKDEVLEKFPPDEEAYTSVPCLMGTYSPMLFIRGYRFPENTEQIYVKKDIDGRSADWTLGAIIYEYEKSPHRHEYACPISLSEGPTASKAAAAFLILPLFVSYLF